MATDLYARARARLARERGKMGVDRASAVRFVLGFPNTYSVGMASLGFQLVYGIINELPNASCERAFLPDPEDFEEHQRSGTHLFSLESGTGLNSFDVVAFSVSFEMDYLNVLRMLDLGRVPLRAADRHDGPLVIAGGPCATFNPEPLAHFVDAFVIGDAEPVLKELTAAVEATADSPRRERLLALSRVPGVYVPSLYAHAYGPSGRLESIIPEPGVPRRARRAVATELWRHSGGSMIRTTEAEFGDIKLVEMTRGCGRHCRFCVAGFINRPPRNRKIGVVPEEDRLGLVGASVFDHPEAEAICEAIVEAGGEFTVSSVRLDTVTPKLAALLAQGGQKTITLAPEAGSQRLREVINKRVTEEQLLRAVKAASEAGLQKVKLYFMIGLPTETDEDVDAIVDLVARLARQFGSIAFSVSASSFVPKPFTPFQWCAMERQSTLKRRYEILRRGIARIRGVKFSGESPRLAAIQGWLARGDRRIAEVLEEALRNGGDYAAALRKTGIAAADYLYRERDRAELLPWDAIDNRVTKDYLWKEYCKAVKEDATAACRVGRCKTCGACDILDEDPQLVSQ